MKCKAKWTETVCRAQGKGCSHQCEKEPWLVGKITRMIDTDIIGYESTDFNNGSIEHEIKVNSRRTITITEYWQYDDDEYCTAGDTDIEYLIIDGEYIVGEPEKEED